MRLIDADALRDLIFGGYDIDFSETPELTRELLNVVDYQETIDAVPIVRCKDCKWAYLDESHFICGYRGFFVNESFYCADGERKEQNDGTAGV